MNYRIQAIHAKMVSSNCNFWRYTYIRPMKLRKIITLAALILPALLFAQEKNMNFRKISQKEAKSIMDSRKDIIILDVRTRQEFSSGHIPNAIVIPVEELTSSNEMPGELNDKKKTILVYCRSGRRSTMAAQHLARLGYENILEFGGITTWPYSITEQP